MLLLKVGQRFFQILWPSQKTQTLVIILANQKMSKFKIHILTIYEQMDLEMAIIFRKNSYLRDFYTITLYV